MSGKKYSKRNPSVKSESWKQDLKHASNRENLRTLQRWFLRDDSVFSRVTFHGNTSWAPGNLVWQAIFWAWSESKNSTDAFTEARDCCEKNSSSPILNTYQGFMGALVTWTSIFIPLLFSVLQARMKEVGGRFWEIDGWVPIAFDGSRSTAPRTKQNEKAFCAPNYGKGRTARYGQRKAKGLRRKKNQKAKRQPQVPQTWITMMWHMGLRLPFRWLLGPSNSSERNHVMEMLKAGKFPASTLFCGDAGFVGYALWSAMLEKGTHFLVRIGGNVNLLSELAIYRREDDDVVLCWPKAMLNKNQPPIRLRLVKVYIGKRKAWLLTSVLHRKDLNAEQMVKFYKMRWGIELEFRGLKQTLDRAKLRSRNDQRLLAELDWSIMAMAVAELFALKEQLSKKKPKPSEKPSPADPAKRSLAETIRTLRWCLRHLDEVPQPGEDLRTRLRLAVTDNYQRKNKKARYRPTNPDKKPLGNPKLRKITSQEKIRLNKLEEKQRV